MAKNRIQFQRGLSLNAFLKAYGSEAQCRDAVAALRWPAGFVCPQCGGTSHCILKNRALYQCNCCRHQTSVMAQTIFHRTKLPLTTWLLAIFLLTQSKNGLSALALARELFTTKARRMPAVIPSCAKSCITSNRSRGCCRSMAATSLPPYMSANDTTGISRSVSKVSRAFGVSAAYPLGVSAAHHNIDLDLDLDSRATHQQLGFANLSRSERMGLESTFLQAFHRAPDSRIDALQCLVAGRL